jgi:hypothetical protein
MKPTFRRVVTGHDPSGKSIVVSDSHVAEGTLGNFNFYKTLAATSSLEADLAAADIPFFPRPGETIFRIFSLPPGDPKAPPQALAEFAESFFAGVGWPAAKVDTSRHPLMHTTPTTDYIVLLSGEASLLLDMGDPIKLRPFDAVIQRATNHAWLVTGNAPAVLMAVMVGKSESASHERPPAP